VFDVDLEKNGCEKRHLEKSVLYYLFEGSYQNEKTRNSLNDEMKIYSKPPEKWLTMDEVLKSSFNDKERVFIVQEENDDLK